jgi:hypothetical protein
MARLTREQRVALYNVYQRVPLDFLGRPVKAGVFRAQTGVSYYRFRHTVRPYIGGDCIIVPWCGMWLGIEKDGHTHS